MLRSENSIMVPRGKLEQAIDFLGERGHRRFRVVAHPTGFLLAAAEENLDLAALKRSLEELERLLK